MGRLTEEELGMIDEWHGGAARNVPLHEYLGYTWEEWRELLSPYRNKRGGTSEHQASVRVDGLPA